MSSWFGRLPFLVVIVAAACAPAAPVTPAVSGGVGAPREERAESQALRVIAGALIGNPTPQASNSNAYQYFPLYDSLTVFGENATVLPWIATKWEASADGLTWTFTIRDDVTFSNGDKLTAEDVVFTIQQVLEKRWPQLTYIATVAGARVINPTTLAITTRQVDVTLPSGTTYLWIVPKAYFERVGFEGFVQQPIGSGPYELVEFRSADRILYRKRSTPHTFRKANPTEILIRAVVDASQQVNGLRTGEAHIVAGPTYQADQAEQLKREGFVIYNKPTGIGGVRFTQSVYEAKNSPLKDKRVRQALNYAVDRETLTRVLYGSYGRPDSQWALPGSQYYDPSVPIWPYDPVKAKQLLAEAGYPNGFKADMDYSTSMTSPTLVQAIQAYFREVGVEVSANAYEQGIYVDKVYGRNNQSISELSPGGNGDTNGFNSGSRVFIGCGRPSPQQYFYCNLEWDRLMDLAYAERDDAKRRQIFLQANKVFRDDVPVVFLYTADSLLTASPKVRGWQVPMPLSFRFDEVYLLK
ncbi:MAG: ABC transporter substrate-binding protein [Chloroflexi bacterium]|nr:ABC transporter substrate-binding protein [Chloroflexota bacterium]